VPAAEREKTPAKVEQKAEPKADAKSDAKTDTKQTANADPDGPKNEPKAGDFAVQLVAVRDAANAQKVLNNLRELGYKSAYREKIDVTNGQVIRVRTGPYKEKATAERVHKELKEKGFDATIVAIK
jgi:cell division septation protein DedD